LEKIEKHSVLQVSKYSKNDDEGIVYFYWLNHNPLLCIMPVFLPA